MNENSKIIKFIRRILKKEVSQNDELKKTIEENIVNDIIDKQNLENEVEIDMVKENIKDSEEEITLYTESSNIDGIQIYESDEDEVIEDIGINIIENLKIERMGNSMGDIIKIKGSNPCEITNDLNQAILKVPKHVITPEQLAAVAATVNLGHLNNQEFLDVAFKYTKEIENPCGGGTIQGETLLKAVVIVATVDYSFILYDSITKALVYDGVQDAITAYSVYDIIAFDEQKIPTSVTPNFTITKFEQLPDNPELAYYMFVIEGTVDLVGV